MKTPTLGPVLLLPLVAAQSTTWPAPLSWTASAVLPAGTGNNGAPICGQGYTYCGYILRDHQSSWPPIPLPLALPLTTTILPFPSSTNPPLPPQASPKKTLSKPTAPATKTTAPMARPKPTPSKPSTSASPPPAHPSSRRAATPSKAAATGCTTTTTSSRTARQQQDRRRACRRGSRLCRHSSLARARRPLGAGRARRRRWWGIGLSCCARAGISVSIRRRIILGGAMRRVSEGWMVCAGGREDKSLVIIGTHSGRKRWNRLHSFVTR